MRVTFVLPGYLRRPNGGYKVVYEYASRLQARGHRVTVLHPYAWPFDNVRLARLRAWRWRRARQLLDRPLAPWFPHHPGVRLLLVPRVDDRSLPDGDAVFATGWETASPVAKSACRTGAKFYLIQHYETWTGDKDAVDATWRLPLHKVVIARWLRDLADGFGEGERTTYIPNGLDLERFPLLAPVAGRDRLRVGMLYHRSAWKGSADGVAALSRVRESHPNLDVTFFGALPRGEGVPAWATYAENPPQPDLVRLYNSWSLFLHPSWTEGWPLPPAEAMACGCALVAAANEGVTDYADDGTAVLAPVKRPEALATGLLRLLGDDPLRQRVALAGYRRIREFTWVRAVDSLERLLLDRATEVGTSHG